MNRLFTPDGPVISFCAKLADLMLLNILFLIACVPVITIGAAVSAMYYVTLKMVIYKEDNHVLRTFLRSFAQNFKKSTAAWLIYGCIFSVLAVDYFVFTRFSVQTPLVIKLFSITVFIATVMNMNCTLAQLGFFDNKLKQTLKNSLLICVASFAKCLMSAILFVTPIYLLICVKETFPVVLLVGFSGCIYIGSLLWKDVFPRYMNADTEEK